MKKFITLALLALPLFVFAQERLDLSGEWKVSLNNRGNQTIMLPNTLDGAGIGEPNTLSPALTKPQLSRLTRKHSFIGEAKYQSGVYGGIPAADESQRRLGAIPAVAAVSRR